MKTKDLIDKLECNNNLIKESGNKIDKLYEGIKESVAKEDNNIKALNVDTVNFIKKLVDELGLKLILNKEFIDILMTEDNEHYFKDYNLIKELNKKIEDELEFKKLFTYRPNYLEILISKEDIKDDVLKNAELCGRILESHKDIKSFNKIKIFEDSLSEYGIYTLVKEGSQFKLVKEVCGIYFELKEFETINEAFMYISEHLTYN